MDLERKIGRRVQIQPKWNIRYDALTGDVRGQYGIIVDFQRYNTEGDEDDDGVYTVELADGRKATLRRYDFSFIKVG